MNLYQCENKAKDIGYDKAKFIALFPKGLVECQWADAYFGIFKIEGMKGHVTTRQIDNEFPDLVCTEPYV